MKGFQSSTIAMAFGDAAIPISHYQDSPIYNAFKVFLIRNKG